MPCEHLRELYDLCEKHELLISSRDAIRVVCRQCEEQDVCPSSLTDGEIVLKVSEPNPPGDAKADETRVSDTQPGDQRPR